MERFIRRLLPLIQGLLSRPWVPILLAFVGWGVYLWQAWNVAHFKTSFLDEGLYLYKGLLFATGKYRPFQEYGLWTNHMPLAFLIPGYIQKWFGAGLATARYFMIIVASFTLLGLWIVVRRWSGRWWAAGAVWALALNAMSVKVYTLAISEGLIACMMVWMLVLMLGVKRPLWQVLLAPVMAVLMFYTRLNLGFVLPIVILYIFWKFGRRTGLLATLVSGMVLLGLTALFWPGVLQLLIFWIPEKWSPFLASFRLPSGTMGQFLPPDEVKTPYSIFLYFWLTFRVHFLSLVGACLVWLLWPWGEKLKLSSRVKAAIFLSVLLAVLLLAHMAASFGTGYCVSCILLYVSFFDYLGLILLPVAFRLLRPDLSRLRQILIFVVILVLIGGVGYSAYEDISSDFAKRIIEQWKDTYLWQALRNVTGLSALMLFRRMAAIVGSLGFVAVLFGLYRLMRKFVLDRQIWRSRSAYLALLLFLAIGAVLTPTRVLGKGNDFFDCGKYDVLESYSEVGAYLRSVIPQGSKVYWDGRIPTIFLYLPGVEIYPAQLNHTHSFLIGGDPQQISRYAWWNDALARQWLAEADYVLLEKGLEQDWVMQVVSTDSYIPLQSTRKPERCRWQSIIDIYQRVKSVP